MKPPLPEANLSWLKTFATRIADDLRRRDAVSARIYRKSQFAIERSDTGGWSLEFGELKEWPSVKLEVWLDRYTDRERQRLWYGFGAYRRNYIDTLAQRAVRLYGKPVLITNEELADDDRVLHLAAPLAEKQYRKPILSVHSVSGYGFYEWNAPPFTSLLEDDVLQAAIMFFEKAASKRKTSQTFMPATGAPGLEELKPVELDEGALVADVLGGAQGFAMNPAARLAIELYAMRRAIDHFERRDFAVNDVSAKESYDLLCSRDGKEMKVEVKGTVTKAGWIFLTANEMALAKGTPDYGLFLVRGIEINDEGDEPVAFGGEDKPYLPWKADLTKCKPVFYRCPVG